MPNLKSCKICNGHQEPFHGHICQNCRSALRRQADGRGISNKQRDDLVLTERQKEILVGHLLGDGNLNKGYPTRRPMLRLAYAVKTKAYVEWSAKEFSNLIRTGVRLRNFGDKGVRAFYSSRRLKCLEPWFEAWYGTGKKALPTNPEFLDKYLTPLAIATWYQDDGSKHKSGAFLSSESFTKEENQRLANLLIQRIGGRISLSRIKEGFRLYIQKSEGTKDRFIEMVSPHVQDCFLYKIS